MFRQQRLTLTTTLTFLFCALLVGCSNASSGVSLPAPYGDQGQTSVSNPGGGTPSANTPCCGPTVQTTPAVQADPPTPAPAAPQCDQYQETGKGITRSYSFTVPSGCVLVSNAYAGNLAGHDWSGGAVLAAPAGTYSGSLTDGAFKIVSMDTGPQEFCAQVQVMRDNNWALSNEWPLSGWPACN